MSRTALFRLFLALAVLSGVTAAVSAWYELESALAVGSVAGCAFLALTAWAHPRLRGFSFSLWVGTFVVAALFEPARFLHWGTFEQKTLIVPLIQVIMFGMGTTLSLGDFAGVLKTPRAVGIGMLLQFTVMPLTGAALAIALRLPPEVAAGIVLIGSCPGGVASNLMTYLARGNVALSVTMTACSTLVSPLATPLAMKLLAGQYIEIEFVSMLLTILRIILLPILLGVFANKLLRVFRLDGPWLERGLSFLAMAAICYVIAIITALSRDQLLSVGLLLIIAAVLHNAVGYTLGYWGAAAAGLDKTTRRTVAIEVGLQNGGMASGLAIEVLKSSHAALASAIFGPWMNISGSILASWWRNRPIAPPASANEVIDSPTV